MKQLIKVGLLILALSGCDSGPLKSRGKLVVTNSSPDDVEVLSVIDIGDNSVRGTILSGHKIEAYFASASAPTSCTIEWRSVKPKGSTQWSRISLAHLAGTRKGGYEFVLDGALTWNVVPVPYPGAAPPPKP